MVVKAAKQLQYSVNSFAQNSCNDLNVEFSSPFITVEG